MSSPVSNPSTRRFLAGTVLSLLTLGSAAFSQGMPDQATPPAAQPASFSSSYASPSETPSGVGVQRPPRPLSGPSFQPFSSLAVTVKATSTGIGFDLAVPMNSWLALRSGATYFSYNTTINTDGLNIVGALHLQNASTSLDIHPFHNSFRISPGLSYANRVAMGAAIMVPGGQSFSLGDGGDYTSDPSNPIHGTGSFLFGNRVDPRITVGFANILSRHSGRFGMPIEAGFQYTSQPTVKLAITGNSCATTSEGTGCGPVDQASVVQEQQQLQSDLAPLRFYPIVSIGFSYKFGAHRRAW